MQQSGKQQLVTRPEQQLLCCSVAESAGMVAAVLNGNELTAKYTSFSEQLKKQPRKTYR
jgi:hypothetical protein